MNNEIPKIDSLTDIFQKTSSGNLFFEIKDGMIFPKFGTGAIFQKTNFLPIHERKYVKHNMFNYGNFYNIQRSIFCDGLLETMYSETADPRYIIDVHFANGPEILSRYITSGYTVIEGGRLKDSPVLVIDDFGDQGFDHKQILVGRTNDYDIKELQLNTCSDEELKSFKQQVSNYYIQKYKIPVR